MDHLHSLHGAGYAKKFHDGMAGGLGTGRYEGQGTGGAMFSRDTQDFSGHMKGGFWGALASLALPLVGKLLGAGKMTKDAHDEMKEMMEEHEKKYHSGKKLRGGFWGALASIGIPLVAKLLGAGKMTQDAHDELCEMLRSKGRSQMKGKGRVVGGASAGARLMVESDSDEESGKKMKGKGFLSSLGIPLVSDVAGMFGLGKKKTPMNARCRQAEIVKCVMEEKPKSKRMVSSNDGRRKRAAVVKHIMAEKGLSMIDASKYVKEHGLYVKS
jgi:hypothetical protein